MSDALQKQGDVVIASEQGAIILETGGLERHRVNKDGTGTGVFAGSLPPVISSIVRNGYGELSSFAVNGVTFSATRNAFGVVQTVTDGTTTRTVSRDGFGVITGVS